MAYTRPYPGGWEDSPSEDTPITAASLDAIDDALEAGYDRVLTVATVDTTDDDTWEFWVGGVRKAWGNEWRAIRGTSPYSWGDALVRAIRENSDGITTGEFIQLVDRRTGAPAAPGNVTYGRRWTDGALVRYGIVMGEVYVLAPGEDESDIPAALPVNTIVWQDD